MTVHDSPDLAGLEAAEDRLQAAVAANDADGLALSLHDELLATAPDGSFATKAEDVAGYASGAFRLMSYRQLRRRSLVRAGTGVTAVRAHIQGSAGGDEFEVVMDYTRTWVHEDGRWQVLAAHLSLAATTDAAAREKARPRAQPLLAEPVGPNLIDAPRKPGAPKGRQAYGWTLLLP